MALILLLYIPKMTANSSMKNAVLALGLLMLLGGCQSAQRANTAASLDNAGFMTAWGAYRHCQVGTDLDTMYTEMQQLSRTALTQESAATFPFSLPDFVKRVVSKPTQRLAADPKAMAAACALSTGQAALRAERMELATEMFRAVLQNHTHPEYAYYVAQARIGLNQAELGIQFAGHVTDVAPVTIPVSSASPTPNNSTPVSLKN